MKRILVGVMSCGENEYLDCLSEVRCQEGVLCDLFEVKNRPNKEAHDVLYSTFNEKADGYDYFAKVDADMVFVDRAALKKITDEMSSHEYDHMMVDVKDALSEIFIPGFNVYSSRVRWEGNRDRLIVDYHGTAESSTRRMDWHLVDHMPNPSLFQSFSYGVHRAKKAVQAGIKQKDLSRAILHWTILSQVSEAYRRAPTLQRASTLLGAKLAFTDGRFSSFPEYKSEELKSVFDQQLLPRLEADAEGLLDIWQNPLIASGIWLAGLKAM